MQDRSSHILMQHYRNPVANQLLDRPDFDAKRRNNLCGDEIHLQFRMDETGKIIEFGWHAKGCMLVKSSASILSDVLTGRPLDEARGVAGSFITWLDDVETSGDDHNAPQLIRELGVFDEMSNYPGRIPCIKLPWRAFMDAISQS
ncbi:MAG TPA: iron-sulfur cluster assembly scaffold protein [Balneolales bacterium]|nr:iron-sulfur cluster assembly scaffold protein [Balneolales bacterium]